MRWAAEISFGRQRGPKRKFYRPLLELIWGLCGLLLASLFWTCFREAFWSQKGAQKEPQREPKWHPKCNLLTGSAFLRIGPPCRRELILRAVRSSVKSRKGFRKAPPKTSRRKAPQNERKGSFWGSLGKPFGTPLWLLFGLLFGDPLSRSF